MPRFGGRERRRGEVHGWGRWVKRRLGGEERTNTKDGLSLIGYVGNVAPLGDPTKGAGMKGGMGERRDFFF